MRKQHDAAEISSVITGLSEWWIGQVPARVRPGVVWRGGGVLTMAVGCVVYSVL